MASKSFRVRGNVVGKVRRVAIVAPASRPPPEAVEACRQALEQAGIAASVDHRIFNDAGWTAGTDTERIAALSDALLDDEIDCILCARGGFGSPKIADALPKPRGRKVIVGYSDATYLLNRFAHLPNVKAVHGAMAIDFLNASKAENVENLIRLLTGADLSDELSADLNAKLELLHPGRIDGPLAGGNLISLQLLIGTENTKHLHGKVLFLEEVGERMYVLDRVLDHLKRAGIFRACKGILIGEMDPKPDEGNFSFATLQNTVLSIARAAGVPAYSGFPAGHGRRNYPITLGTRFFSD